MKEYGLLYQELIAVRARLEELRTEVRVLEEFCDLKERQLKGHARDASERFLMRGASRNRVRVYGDGPYTPWNDKRKMTSKRKNATRNDD